MLFNEIYGYYYQAVSKIIKTALDGTLTKDSMKDIAMNTAFEESFLQIIPSLESHKWPLLLDDMTTPIKHDTSMPLTELELRWLKTISLDERIKLFNLDLRFLDDIEPLFDPSDYHIFDAYGDGDCYTDSRYIEVFKFLLNAIKTKSRVKLEYNSNKGNNRWFTCEPIKMEYSEKDDKFRLHIAGCRYANVLNVAGINRYEDRGAAKATIREVSSMPDAYILCQLKDERNALERFLLHFAHFKKEVWTKDDLYEIKIEYNTGDETELLIRILSFGPFVKVIEPTTFVNLIKERLYKQKSCEL